MASVTDPATWGTFEEAHRTGMLVGFVLSPADPYAIIDLDNKADNPVTADEWRRHVKILEAFDSYTELSTSGRGYHIVIRGALPQGVHRDKVEAYSSGRYMICTGNVVRASPITDQQPMLDLLYGEMKADDKVALVDVQGSQSDAQVIHVAMTAANAEKFVALARGDMTGYPSQSEADFALLSIIAYYTPDNEQVRRLFRLTELGKRVKATKNDVYLDRALEKIRAKQPPPVDMSALLNNAAAMMQGTTAMDAHGGHGAEHEHAHAPTSEHGRGVDLTKLPSFLAQRGSSDQLDIPKGVIEQDKQVSGGVINHPALITADNEVTHLASPQTRAIELPPGIIGELAQYFYSAAIRPVKEIALAAAIGVAAGVVGRSYNISGSGLNQYLILLAKTGSGKEGALSGIENLLAAVRPSIPMADQFLGPAAFASGQALVKVLNDRPCFVSVLGEFGLTLQQLSDHRANSAQVMLRKVFLDLYAKSGWDRRLRASVYSDTDKNTNVIQAPNVSVLGESTPETFYDGLDSSHIMEGLIPRFSVIEYQGDRPPRNRHANLPPPPDLVKRFCDLIVVALTTTNNNTCCPVQIDGRALTMLDAFDSEADGIMNSSGAEAEVQLWNRAHLKALKLAALVAVGQNPHNPAIDEATAQWAIAFTRNEVKGVAARFTAGNIGQGDSKQLHDLRAAIEQYYKAPPKSAAKWGKLHKARIIPYGYLVSRTASIASFRHDRLGSTAALKRGLQSLVENGALAEIPKVTLVASYGFQGVGYGIAADW